MTFKSLLGVFSCLIFSGCWLSNRPLPIPLYGTEFPVPIQKNVVFSEPKKIIWNVVRSDSIHQGHLSHFDINKLPSQPFNPAGFRPVLKPAVTTSFRYNNLPDTILNLDLVPAKPLISKTLLLGNLKKTTLGTPRLKAESFHTFFQYGDEQGLPGQATEVTLHTRDRRIWIATSGGLSVLNGETLETLPYNYGVIFFMAEDAFGQLWITTRTNGLFVIDRKAGIQKQFANFRNLVEVMISKNGSIWITSAGDGVFTISPDQKTYKHLSKRNGLSSDLSIRSMEDPEGRIWITSYDTGVDIFDPSARKIKRLTNELTGRSKSIQTIQKTKNGDIYLSGIHRGIDIFNVRNETHKYLDSVPELMHAETYEMLEDQQERMWITTDSSGIVLLNKSLDSISSIGIRDGLEEDASFSLEKDSEQNMLVGTNSSGLIIFPAASRTAHHLAKKDGLIDNNVWAFLEDNENRLWLGTFSGVNIITPDKKIYQLQINDPLIKDERVDAIIQTKSGTIAMCGRESGLTLIDETSHRLEKIGTEEGMPSKNLRVLYEDSQGLLWIGTLDNGLIVFNPKNLSIRYINQLSGLSSNRVTSI